MSSSSSLLSSASSAQRRLSWWRCSSSLAAAAAGERPSMRVFSSYSSSSLLVQRAASTTFCSTRAFGARATRSPLLRPPRKFSKVQQVPLFPGMYKYVRRFEGEYVYNYGKHTFAIMRESIPFFIIPIGCLIPFIMSYYPSVPDVPFEWQVAYLCAMLVVSRLVARGINFRKLRRDLSGREAVVTGATSGIGLETAAQLAAMGANVTLIAKDSPHAATALAYVKKYAKSEDQVIEFKAVDLCDFIGIRDFCNRQRNSRQNGIDILANCAAVMHTKQVMSRYGDDDMLAVNFLGPYLLVEGLLPLVAQTHGRIVYVSCSAHVGVKGNVVKTYLSGRGVWSPRVADKFDGLEQYGFSKLGNLYHAQELAVRAYPKPTSIPLSRAKMHQIAIGAAKTREEAVLDVPPEYTVCAVNPGAVLSNLYRRVPYASTFKYCYFLYLLVMRTPREGSQGVVNCCVREELVNGGYYMDCRYKPSGLSSAACNVNERAAVLAWAKKKMQPFMKWV